MGSRMIRRRRLKVPTQEGNFVEDERVPGVHGRVIAEGPEVSEVRWPDKTTEYVNNRFLRKVETRG